MSQDNLSPGMGLDGLKVLSKQVETLPVIMQKTEGFFQMAYSDAQLVNDAMNPNRVRKIFNTDSFSQMPTDPVDNEEYENPVLFRNAVNPTENEFGIQVDLPATMDFRTIAPAATEIGGPHSTSFGGQFPNITGASDPATLPATAFKVNYVIVQTAIGGNNNFIASYSTRDKWFMSGVNNTAKYYALYYQEQFMRQIYGDVKEWDTLGLELNKQHFTTKGENGASLNPQPPGWGDHFFASSTTNGGATRTGFDVTVKPAQRIKNGLSEMSAKGTFNYDSLNFLLEQLSGVFYGKGKVNITYMKDGIRRRDNFNGIAAIPGNLWWSVLGSLDGNSDNKIRPRNAASLLERERSADMTKAFKLEGCVVYNNILLTPVKMFMSWKAGDTMAFTGEGNTIEYFRFAGNSDAAVGKGSNDRNNPTDLGVSIPAGRTLYRIPIISAQALIMGFRNMPPMEDEILKRLTMNRLDGKGLYSSQTFRNMESRFFRPLDIRVSSDKWGAQHEALFTMHYCMKKIRYPIFDNEKGTFIMRDRGVTTLDILD